MEHKPLSRITCVGAAQTGKTSLAQRLSASAPSSSWQRQRRPDPKFLERQFESATRRFAHYDLLADLPRKFFHEEAGPLDGVIWVVSFPGVQEEDRLHLRCLRLLLVSPVLVYLNKVDLCEDPLLLDSLELQLRQLLDEEGFSADEIPIIRGSLRPQKNKESEPALEAVLQALDDRVDLQRVAPFFVISAISRKVMDERASVIFTGTHRNGAFRVGDEVVLVGQDLSRATTVTKIKHAGLGLPADCLRMWLKDVAFGEASHKQIVARPGAFVDAKRARVLLWVEEPWVPEFEAGVALSFPISGECVSHSKSRITARPVRLVGSPLLCECELTFEASIALTLRQRLEVGLALGSAGKLIWQCGVVVEILPLVTPSFGAGDAAFLELVTT